MRTDPLTPIGSPQYVAHSWDRLSRFTIAHSLGSVREIGRSGRVVASSAFCVSDQKRGASMCAHTASG
jgi:hypothetical protein